MDNKIECFVASLEGCIYVVPVDLREKFEGTDYYDRKKSFFQYILPDDAILDSVFVDEYDMQCLIDGDLD